MGSYTYDQMDATSHKIDVWFPVGSAGQKFPFISYSHGNTAGGAALPGDYGTLLSTMSAYGYIIAAHESCNSGCARGGTLPFDPPGFATMYKEQLKVIDWAKQLGAAGDTVFKNADFSLGVGIAGHSMGGQATVYSSSKFGSGHGIKAGATHFEPNPLGGAGAPKNLGMWSAAWFKVYLDETPQSGGVDYKKFIFGTDTDSLCHGGDGAMAKCDVYDGSPAPPAPTPPAPPAPTPPAPTPAPTPPGPACRTPDVTDDCWKSMGDSCSEGGGESCLLCLAGAVAKTKAAGCPQTPPGKVARCFCSKHVDEVIV